jgi:hypothetical protein
MILKLCIECKNKSSRCKNLCGTCYSKMYRKTDKGKEATKRYNDNGGVEARRKFMEKINANKPTKSYRSRQTPKIDCECGKPSVSKSLCNTCYQRLYQSKIRGLAQGTRQGKIDSTKIFNDVLFYVKKGFTILNACKKVGYTSSSNLYRLISPIQKAELRAYKILLSDNDDDFI